MKVSIPQPCPANWDQMTPGGDGRFCDECQKIVVDFTKFSDLEILLYFGQREGQGICGQFRAQQVVQPKKIWWKSIYGRAVAFLFGMYILLTSFKPLQTGTPGSVKGKIKCVDSTACKPTKNTPYLKGEVEAPRKVMGKPAPIKK